MISLDIDKFMIKNTILRTYFKVSIDPLIDRRNFKVIKNQKEVRKINLW